MSLRAVRMHPDRSMLCLKWEVPFKRTSHKCPHDQCGQDIKLDPLDTPPRSYLELVETLITSHFGGNCSFCDELLLTSRGVGRSRVGEIEVRNPDSRHTMWQIRFYVFQENGQWCFTSTPPKEPDLVLHAEVQMLDVKQNPLFQGHRVLEERSSMGALALVVASLHPSIGEAVDAKHDSIAQLISAHSMLSTAARLLLMAVGSDMPEHLAAQNAFAVTEAALHASSSALQKWRGAHTDLIRKMLKHPVPKPEDVQLFYEYAQYMRQLV